MDLADFDFELPDERIARFPVEPRDASRLMVVERATGLIAHHRFHELPELLEPADLLVLNETKVLPARLALVRRDTGGKVELLLLGPAERPGRALALARPAKSMRPGIRLVGGAHELLVVENRGDGVVEVELPIPLAELARAIGELPLPPYLGRAPAPSDAERYQTVYARDDQAHSVAAPTAGLHFTEPIFARLRARGIADARIRLHVGPGTFLPVRAERLEDHVMHAERFEVPPEAARAISAARRVVAVGTTVVRTLESLDAVTAGAGSTALFIRPGFRFRHVGALVTNFHLPRSTLLMLVSAFAGPDLVREAYRVAIAESYRFYSYGDAMLIR